MAIGALGLAMAAAMSMAQSGSLIAPRTIEAGASFSIESRGSGKAILYIVGPGQVLSREVELGKAAYFAAGSLYNAGHYAVVLTGDATAAGELDVAPGGQPANLSFLARPSRLPVGLHDGITGAAYVFDAYRNLIVAPTQVSFELLNPAGAAQRRTVATRDGAAWVAMDSSAQQGKGRFIARAGAIASERVIGLVPGDPCGLKMTAKQRGAQVVLETDPVRDCSGNAVPDGTIVSFTETYGGDVSTVEVPLKRGIAKVEMPMHPGAVINVASGVALGNEVRLAR